MFGLIVVRISSPLPFQYSWLGGGHIFYNIIADIKSLSIHNLILTTMDYGLFKKPKRAARVCRVENINPKENIVAEMHTDDQKEYKVCLCLSGRNIRTSFPSETRALNHMESYRIIHKNN